MNAPRLRALTTALTANSVVMVELPDGTVIPIEGHRLESATTPDNTAKTTHLILQTTPEVQK